VRATPRRRRQSQNRPGLPCPASARCKVRDDGAGPRVNDRRRGAAGGGSRAGAGPCAELGCGLTRSNGDPVRGLWERGRTSGDAPRWAESERPREW
jgi:hypothetical protein